MNILFEYQAGGSDLNKLNIIKSELRTLEIWISRSILDLLFLLIKDNFNP